MPQTYVCPMCTKTVKFGTHTCPGHEGLDYLKAQVAELTAELLASSAAVTKWSQECNKLDGELKAAREALTTVQAQLTERSNALTAAQYLLEFHPRVEKLARKGKPFIVIAIDEPYFEQAYLLIRAEELYQGRWTEDDENQFFKLVDAALAAQER